jgi:hypothetical protein
MEDGLVIKTGKTTNLESHPQHQSNQAYKKQPYRLLHFSAWVQASNDIF